MVKLKIALPIILVIVYTGLILLSSIYLKTAKLFSISTNTYINFQANYQIILLGITLLSLVTTYFLNRVTFTNFFTFGNLSATSEEMKLFGIKAGDSWLKTGISLTIIISLVTGIFMFFQLKNVTIEWEQLQSGIFWILLFSLTNSFGEEMIYRMGIVSPLIKLLSPMTIFIISAILFGLPHLAGMPSGLIGATMAGVLGLVLAKSLYETNGFFWAWTIHFIQDIIIIGALFLLSTKTT
ncbi:MAG: CPBP family intramembrane glutamic endopeptidase [Ferruginibacter sp.]|nr:CPBP family intramembrane metalloprotease [Ferruginibacter sp.]